MKIISHIAAVTLLGAGIAQAQISIPDPTAPGASYETAVRMVSTSDIMLEGRINRWLRKHYPGWDADPLEFQEVGNERYAVVYITHQEHASRRVYFRVLQSHADPDAQDPAFPF